MASVKQEYGLKEIYGNYIGVPANPLGSSNLTWQTALVAVLLCFWEGFPFPLLGIPNLIGYQAYALIVFAGTAIFLMKTLIRQTQFTRWDYFPLMLFVYCVFVSARYSLFLEPQDFKAWLPSVYTIAPILIIFLLRVCNCKLSDAETAIYWTGFLGSLLLMINNFSGINFLSFYARGSAFSAEERIVFFKLEASFCLMIAAIRLIYAHSKRLALREFFVLMVTFYNVFVVSESRLAIGALLLALSLTWLFVIRGKRKFVVLILAPFIAVPIVIYVIEKFLINFNDMDQYFSNDVSASFRQIEIDHFYNYFADTTGLGFGFMSGRPEFNNIIAYSANYAGYTYGTGAYGLGLDDIGIYSALYQYGYIGLTLIVTMTVLAVISLVRSAKLGSQYATVAGVGFLMLSFMFSPISMNYFTLFYSAHMGGLLWFMAASAEGIRCKRLAAVQRRVSI